jgi:flagellar hook assembly protein FlgD
VRVNGTSCSTPLAAGACALVLQKNPTWTPMMLREAARATATQSASPDNNVGWGILQAHDASEHEIIAVAEGPGAPPSPQRTVITIQNEPNPFNPLTTIRIQVHGTEGSTDLSAVIFDIAGRRVRDFGRLELSGGYVALTWDGKSDSGTPLPSAVYMFRARTSHVSQTRKLLLLR